MEGGSRGTVRTIHESKFLWRGITGVVDEVSSRRSRFRPGKPICLTNDQEWTFPAPTADSEFAVESAAAEYLGLINAVQEAEDQSERRLAELALAIFLIDLNYQLSSSDLENLFTFQPRSRELADSQHAFELLARDHILRWQGVGSYLRPFLPPAKQGGRLAVASWLGSHRRLVAQEVAELAER